MLLAIDVGNTTVAAVVFRGRAIVHRGRVPTPAAWDRGLPAKLLPTAWARQADAAIVSSVVPRLDRPLAAAIAAAGVRRPLFLDHRTPTGIALRIDRPAQLGADRIADCAGALSLFPPPLIVIDSGTATTFDLLDASGAYRGGCILPGVDIAIRSLAGNTAKLKAVAFAVPRSAVGTNTGDSIRAGIFHGTVGALVHLIGLYRRELGQGTTVVATGGLLRHFQGRVPGIDAFEPDLIFLGLRRIHEGLAAKG
jgi:type III pantothenate kinase